MTEPIEGEVVTTVTLLDRELLVHEPSELQTAVMMRAFQRARRIFERQGGKTELSDDDARVVMASIATWLDVFQQFLVKPEDQDWIEQKMINRELMYFKDVQPLMMAFQVEEPEKPNRAARRAKR